MTKRHPVLANGASDERLRATIEFDVPLTDRINWRVYGGYSDYLSNLPSADYDQSIVGTVVELTF